MFNRVFQNFGRWDEWHLELEKNVTMDNLGSYPACPHSSKKRDLSAIRAIDLRAQAEARNLRRPDIHEEAPVKTGARRARDLPNIHSNAATASAVRIPTPGILRSRATAKVRCAVVNAHLKSIMPENAHPDEPVFLGGGARPNARFQELCALAGIKPRKNIETGLDEPWELKDLRKTCATYYDEHLPESSVEILGHSVGGITYRHYAHRALLAFK